MDIGDEYVVRTLPNKRLYTWYLANRAGMSRTKGNSVKKGCIYSLAMPNIRY